MKSIVKFSKSKKTFADYKKEGDDGVESIRSVHPLGLIMDVSCYKKS